MKSKIILVITFFAIGSLAHAGLSDRSFNWGYGNCSGKSLCIDIEFTCKNKNGPMPVAVAKDRYHPYSIRGPKEIIGTWIPDDPTDTDAHSKYGEEEIGYHPFFDLGKYGYSVALSADKLVIKRGNQPILVLGELSLRELECDDTSDEINGHALTEIKLNQGVQVKIEEKGFFSTTRYLRIYSSQKNTEINIPETE